MKVIIVGAGASGLMCAYKLKEKGIDVLVLEKGEKAGRKICITGKGRCNLTNNCTQNEFFKNIISNPKFLYSAYFNFNSQDTITFFENAGVNLITERGNRVFPISYRASDVSNALITINRKIGVEIKYNQEVISIYKDKNEFVVKTKDNIYKSDKVVVATGGMSYKYTGSSGDGYKFAKSFGHKIINPVPSLCTIKIKENIPSDLYKFTFKNVVLHIYGESFNKKEFGELTFYKEGIAGPISLTLSSYINRIEDKKLNIEIDFKPALSIEKLDQRLIKEIQNGHNKTILDLLKTLLPTEIIPWFIKLNELDELMALDNLKKEYRIKILNSLKSFKLSYDGLDNIDRAVVTSGGISTKEINPQTMESKIVEGLYFIGEVIDVDALTGGFNLQIAFSTAALLADKI